MHPRFSDQRRGSESSEIEREVVDDLVDNLLREIHVVCAESHRDVSYGCRKTLANLLAGYENLVRGTQVVPGSLRNLTVLRSKNVHHGLGCDERICHSKE